MFYLRRMMYICILNVLVQRLARNEPTSITNKMTQMRKSFFPAALLCCTICLFMWTSILQAQVTERERPAHWSQLVKGARFMDRFRPMEGNDLRSDVWGAVEVRPRLLDNGIEDSFWSYWGGNIVEGDDGLWHQFVAAWLEASEKGHMEWGNSWVVHAVGPTPHGPFRPLQIVGRGHNPEIYRTDNGTWVLYVINGRYTSQSLNGPWEYGKFEFDPQGKPIIEGLSNLSFARRPDGGWVMVCRGGGIWFGLSKGGWQVRRPRALARLRAVQPHRQRLAGTHRLLSSFSRRPALAG